MEKIFDSNSGSITIPTTNGLNIRCIEKSENFGQKTRFLVPSLRYCTCNIRHYTNFKFVEDQRENRSSYFKDLGRSRNRSSYFKENMKTA